jgi:hypothetical protein
MIPGESVLRRKIDTKLNDYITSNIVGFSILMKTQGTRIVFFRGISPGG